MRFKPPHKQTIVITGASSGIGLATARAAARHGAKQVPVSRNGDALAKITNQMTGEGGAVTRVAADVAKRDELEKVAEAAFEHFGGFHTWVNCAGVDIFGKLQHVGEADHRRLMETNFRGVVNGSLVALKHLQGNGGRQTSTTPAKTTRRAANGPINDCARACTPVLHRPRCAQCGARRDQPCRVHADAAWPAATVMPIGIPRMHFLRSW